MSWWTDAVHAGEKALDMVLQPGKLVDSFSSHTTTPERELGQTTNPRDLIRGDPSQIQQLSGRLLKIGGAAGETASGLSRIDIAQWHGPAADAFHDAFGQQPRAWSDAATAFDSAATAVARYGETISWAQQQAQHALDLYRQGVRTTAIAKTDYARQAKQYQRQAQAWNTAVVAGAPPSGPKPVPPGPFVDPGQAARDQAQAVLTTARQQRDDVAADTMRALLATMQSAPPAPSEDAQFGDDLVDTFGTGLSAAGSFIGGVGTAVEDLLRFVRQVDPLEPQNVTHPAEYLQGLSTIAAGVVHSVIHPSELVTGLVGDNNSWKADPMAAAGKLTGNVLLAVGTGGIGAEADAASAAGAVGRAAERLAKPRDLAETPKPAEIPKVPETPKPVSATRPPEIHTSVAPADPHPFEQLGGDLGRVEHEIDSIHTRNPEIAPHHGGSAPAGHRPIPPPTLSSRAGNLGQESIAQDLTHVEHEIDSLHVHKTPSGPQHNNPDYSNRLYTTDRADRSAYTNKFPPTKLSKDYLAQVRHEHPDVTDPLHDSEILALQRMTTMDHADINSALRSGDQDGLTKMDPEIRNAVSGLNKLPNYHGPVYRGIHVDPGDLETVLDHYTPGETVQEPAFTSTDKQHPHETNVQFIIDSTTGKDISWLQDPHVGQQEVLYPPGAKFTVIRHRYDEDTGRWIIELHG